MSKFSLQIRFYRSKEALLVLIWTVFNFSILSSPIVVNTPYVLLSMMWFPVAGCLSDICVKRYVIIRYSLWFTWLFLILSNIILIIQQYMWSSHVLHYLFEIGAFFILFGMAGVWTNTFQFGIDQLTDASSSDIKSYISWYVWTFCFASSAISLLQNCSCREYNTVIAYFPLPLLGTLALVTDCLFNKSLVKEPPTQNTFKLIYQVLKFAAKNKHPRMRSAFTYWEDKPYSRIDLGKMKYGGPFTTEQVEDVKTFFRFLPIIAVFAPYCGIVYVLYSSFRDFKGFYEIEDFTKRCADSILYEYLFHCFERNLVRYLPFISVVLIIPIFEVFLYPFLSWCHCIIRVKIAHQLILGILLLLMYELFVVAIEIAIVSVLNVHPLNSTCPLYENHNLGNTKIVYKLLIGSQPILGTAIYVLLSSYLEFLCAQSPYSMKGLIIGIVSSAGILSVAISTGMTQALKSTIKSFGSKCQLWLYTAILSLTTVLMCIQFISLKYYKLRKREDTLRNDQMFAVDYFNKYLPSKPQHSRGKSTP